MFACQFIVANVNFSRQIAILRNAIYLVLFSFFFLVCVCVYFLNYSLVCRMVHTDAYTGHIYECTACIIKSNDSCNDLVVYYK